MKLNLCIDCLTRPVLHGYRRCGKCYYQTRKQQDQKYKRTHRDQILSFAKKYYKIKRDLGLINHPCEKCGYSDHLEIIQIHHKDRDRKNNQGTNLESLCPNCHLWEHFLTRSGPFSPKKYSHNVKELD